MLNRSPTQVAALAALALTLASLLCTPIARACQQPAEDDDFAVWLVHVQWCYRLDEDPAMSRRIAELQAKRQAAATPADRRSLDREIEKAKAESQKSRPHAIYGWSTEADDAGKPINSTRSMAGFILTATNENNKAIAEAQKAAQQGKPAIIALQREAAKDLFSHAGRRWALVRRAAFLKNPPDISAPHPLSIPLDRPLTEAQRRAVDVSITHERNENLDSGSTLHRYSLRIRCDQPPANTSRLQVWTAAHITLDGERVGPIIDFIEVPRSANGTFAMTRSFEFIAKPGVKMDVDATTAELKAMEWN